MSYYIQVALATGLRKVFTYLPPSRLNTSDQADIKTAIPLGIRVEVPFGHSTRIGLVVDHHQQSSVDTSKLKNILTLLDTQPLLSKTIWDLGQWACAYYQYPLGDGLLHILPVSLRQGHNNDPIHRFWQYHLAEDSSAYTMGRAPKQQRTWQHLLSLANPFSEAELNQKKLKAADLNPLIAKGLVTPSKPSVHKAGLQLLTQQQTLNDQQQVAFTNIQSTFHEFSCSLIDGVTGSGKTEVYLHLIAHCLTLNKHALVLVPEIGLIHQLLQRLRQRFNHPVYALHSGLNNRQRLGAWQLASLGQAHIIVGTRSAVFTPIKNLGLIIVDEEHDQAYKQQEGFRYHARDLAIKRAQLENIPIVLGSATPSFESLANAQRKRYQYLVLSQRAGSACAPEYEIIDLRQQPVTCGLSDGLANIIEYQLGQGHQVLLMLNRRGFAPALQCQTCGQPVHCSACDARMTLHKYPARLHCHHCDLRQTIVLHCAACGNKNMAPVGSGTERLEDHLKTLFADYPIYRIDRDTTRGKDALSGMIATIHKGQPCILLGTQMLAKGHHFPHVTVAAIMDADSSLFSSDFRGGEKLAQLIVQTAGRAGRESLLGTAYIQTYQAEHPLIQTLVSGGYPEVASQALAQRKTTLLPPFSYMAILVVQAKQEQHAHQLLVWLQQQLYQNQSHQSHQSLQEHLTQLKQFGPMPATMAKKANYYRVQWQLFHPKRQSLQRIAHYLCQRLEDNKAAKRLKWSIDIDPQEMS